jgi:membrane protease YdiL (CAAX protease family)
VKPAMIIDPVKRFLLLLLEVVVMILIAALIFFLIQGIIGALGFDLEAFYADAASFNFPLKTLGVLYIPLAIGTLSSMFILHMVIFKRPVSEFGFGLRKIALKFTSGVLWSALLIITGFLILRLSGLIEVSKNIIHLPTILSFALLFIVQSGVEELIGRSYLIPTIRHRLNLPIALFLSSIVFAAAHLGNLNVTLIGTLNIFLAGLLMGLLFISTRSFWAPLGFHAGWNFLQGPIFGFEVSGIDMYSIIDSKEIGADWITGGNFGFEGSILATIGLTIASLVFWKKYSNQNRE